MQLTKQDYRLVKDLALKFFLEERVATSETDGITESLFLTKCYTKAVIQMLKSKGLLNERD